MPQSYTSEFKKKIVRLHEEEREGFPYSRTTVHKYMNRMLGLKSTVRPKKPAFQHGEAHKVFENKLK